MTKCKNCGGNNLSHEVKVGRGLKPSNNISNHRVRRISWKGYWDIWTCEDCGKEYKILRR